MRNKLLFLLLYFLSVFWKGALLFSQANLVNNPGFEIYSTCPSNFAQINYCNGWVGASAEYFNSCALTSTQVSIPYNIGGYQQPSNGNAYAAFGIYFSPAYVGGNNVREFAEGALTNSLNIGTKYYVSFNVSMAINSASKLNCASNNIGAMFSTVLYTWSSPAPITNNPKVYTPTVIADSSNWTRVSGSFFADSAYTFIIIGNFFDNNLTDTLIMDGDIYCNTAYYYLDDVCVSTDSLTCNGPIGIETFHYKHTDFNLYPNPAQDMIFYEITLKNNESGLIHIYDLLGKLVIMRQLNPGFNKTAFDLTNFSTGVYLYKVTINSQVKTCKKLIISK